MRTTTTTTAGLWGGTLAVSSLSFIVVLTFLLSCSFIVQDASAFFHNVVVVPTRPISSLISSKQWFKTAVLRTSTTSCLPASSSDNDDNNNSNERFGLDNVFKAGLLANAEEDAADLASKKIRSISDLGWKKSSASRSASIRPKLWAWGGADELALQDKANYDPINNAKNCPEPWLGLEDFYALMKDDTAVADTIFVALAGGRAFVERNVAEQVVAEWYNNNNSAGATKGNNSQRQRRQSSSSSSFNREAFFKTVKKGQQDFIKQWVAFLGVTGFAVLGIVWPTNPLQSALVQGIDALTK